MNRHIEAMNLPDMHPMRISAEKLIMDYRTITYTDDNGVIRWTTNDRVPPQEVLDFWDYMGFNFSMRRSKQQRQADDKKFIEEYKRNCGSPSEEELYEMRAAFGPGTTVVDIITGRSIKL